MIDVMEDNFFLLIFAKINSSRKGVAARFGVWKYEGKPTSVVFFV